MADKKGIMGLSVDGQEYKMRLFVTGASVNSARAIVNLKVILETYLKGKYKLDIIDVHQEPHKAALEQIIALPLLIKSAPGVERRLIGDMSNKEKVLMGLGLNV
jgi:circadian clock protein KaiB